MNAITLNEVDAITWNAYTENKHERGNDSTIFCYHNMNTFLVISCNLLTLNNDISDIHIRRHSPLSFFKKAIRKSHTHTHTIKFTVVLKVLNTTEDMTFVQ